jgi:hypothetical protein
MHDSMAWTTYLSHRVSNPQDRTSQIDPRSLPPLKRRFRGMEWRSRPWYWGSSAAYWGLFH